MAAKAKKPAKKKARPPRQPQSLLDLVAQFGSVSFGKKTARIGVTVERDDLSLAKADDNLCDRRLSLTIHANGNGDQPGQGRLEGMEDDLDITSVADVKGFNVHSTTISFGLTFNVNELKKLAASSGVQFNDFAARAGRVMIAEVDEIPEDEETEEVESGDPSESAEGSEEANGKAE